jgi:hypothetical protein
VSVTRLLADGTEGELSWTSSGELGYLAPVGDAGHAVAIGLSYANLPVSACSQLQARASTGAVHVGPRLAWNLRGRTWLAAGVGGHVGAAGTWPQASLRQRCAEQRLQHPDDPVAYGVRLKDGASSGRVSYAELGWNGYAFVAGADAQVGVLGAPGPGRSYLGVAFFLRHDQVFAAIRDGRYLFRPEGSSSPQLGGSQLAAISGTASMPRLQFGLRAQLIF